MSTKDIHVGDRVQLRYAGNPMGTVYDIDPGMGRVTVEWDGHPFGDKLTGHHHSALIKS